MSLLTDLQPKLDAADAAIANMKAALAAVDYAITIDAQSASTPSATRAARTALRAALASDIASMAGARALAAAQAVAVDPVASGYADAVESARDTLASAAFTTELADAEAATLAALGTGSTLVEVTAALAAADGGHAVDTTDADAKSAARAAARDSFDSALVGLKAASTAVGGLSKGALAANERLSTLIGLAQGALASGKPWQAAVHLGDAEAVLASLNAPVDLSDPGYAVPDVAADPGAAWLTLAEAALDAVTAYETPLAVWADAENARIDAADELARYLDERTVQAAAELEVALTPVGP